MFKLPKSLISFNEIKNEVEKIKNSKLEKIDIVFPYKNEGENIYFLGQKNDSGWSTVPMENGEDVVSGVTLDEGIVPYEGEVPREIGENAVPGVTSDEGVVPCEGEVPKATSVFPAVLSWISSKWITTSELYEEDSEEDSGEDSDEESDTVPVQTVSWLDASGGFHINSQLDELDDESLIKLSINNLFNHDGKYDYLLYSKKDDCVYNLDMHEFSKKVKQVIDNNYIVLNFGNDYRRNNLSYSIKNVFQDCTETKNKQSGCYAIKDLLNDGKKIIIDFKAYKPMRGDNMYYLISYNNKYSILCDDDYFIPYCECGYFEGYSECCGCDQEWAGWTSWADYDI